MRKRGDSHIKMLQVAVLVVALAVPVTVAVGSSSAGAQSTVRDSVHIVLDVSSSMNGDSGTGQALSRLDVAKGALREAVAGLGPGSVDLGLRTFAGCRSDLVVPVGPVEPNAFAATVDGIAAGGATGLEEALRAAVADLSSVPDPGKKTVVLISDGEETCGGSACDAARELVSSSGIEFVVNTVGFLTSPAANAELQCIADVSGGSMSTADDLDGLLGAIRAPVICTVSLIECYAPEVRFHPAERFFPMDPVDFIEGSRLKWVHGADGLAPRTCWRDEEIDDDPEPELLGSGAYQAQQEQHDPSFWNPRRCTNYGKHYTTAEFTRPHAEQPANGARVRNQSGEILEVAEGFVLEWKDYGFLGLSSEPHGLENDPGPGGLVDAPMFAQIKTGDGGRKSIVYHMFYGWDPKSMVNPDDSEIVQIVQAFDGALAHEGDWERMIIELGPDDVPETVRFEGHGCSDSMFQATNYVPWSEMVASETAPTEGGKGHLVDGTHPVLYVAEGSHAAYSYLREAGPRACGEFPLVSGNADATVYESGVSRRWRPWEQPRGLVDPQTQCWYGYGGAWGRGGSFLGGRGHDTGPAGPHWNIADLPTGNTCNTRSIAHSATGAANWGDNVSLTVNGATPGTEVIVSLASVEHSVAIAHADSTGTINISFAIPDGFAPGGHRIIVRYVSTGDIVAVDQINIAAPTSCATTTAGAPTQDDTDADNVTNHCDQFPTDGPYGDYDGDGIINHDDNCPRVPNPDQHGGRDSVGHACDIDRGHNPAISLYQQLTGTTPPPTTTQPDPAPAPTLTAPSVEYKPFTNPPPEPTPAYGFGATTPELPTHTEPAAYLLEEQAATTPPMATPTQQTPITASANDGTFIANTGTETRALAALAAFLVSTGAYCSGLARTLRRPMRSNRNRT